MEGDKHGGSRQHAKKRFRSGRFRSWFKMWRFFSSYPIVSIVGLVGEGSEGN